MKDFMGNPLILGDDVRMIRLGNGTFSGVDGKIVAIGPVKIKVEDVYKRQVWKFPNYLIKK